MRFATEVEAALKFRHVLLGGSVGSSSFALWCCGIDDDQGVGLTAGVGGILAL